MAKKKQTKKHKFKYAAASHEAIGSTGSASGSQEGAGAGGVSSAGQMGQRSRLMSGGSVGRDFSYVGKDLRRIAVLAVTLVGLELALWYVFAHTGVGNSVYALVNV